MPPSPLHLLRPLRNPTVGNSRYPDGEASQRFSFLLHKWVNIDSLIRNCVLNLNADDAFYVKITNPKWEEFMLKFEYNKPKILENPEFITKYEEKPNDPDKYTSSATTMDMENRIYFLFRQKNFAIYWREREREERVWHIVLSVFKYHIPISRYVIVEATVS